MPRKEEEAQYVRLLFSRLAGMADAEPTPGEAPDFLVDRDGQTIGIEVTELVRRAGSSGDLKLREQFQSEVVRAAEQLYDVKGAPGVHVWIHWLPFVVKADVQVVAAELAALIEANLPDDFGPEGWASRSINAWDQLPEPLQNQLAGVTIARSPGSTSFWTIPYATHPEVGAAELAGEIARKEQRAAKYDRQRFGELWLLIYASGRGKPEFVEISNEAKGAVFQTSFNRAFFMDARQQLLELTIAHDA